MQKSFLAAALLTVACTSAEDRTADTAAMADSISTRLVDHYAGVWDVEVRPEGSDSVVTVYTLNTTDSREWYFASPDQKPVVLRIAATRGDTVYAETGPFVSAIRPGVQARSSARAWFDEDQKLVGKTRVRYETTGPDSVMVFDTYGRRKQ